MTVGRRPEKEGALDGKSETCRASAGQSHSADLTYASEIWCATQWDLPRISAA